MRNENKEFQLRIERKFKQIFGLNGKQVNQGTAMVTFLLVSAIGLLLALTDASTSTFSALYITLGIMCGVMFARVKGNSITNVVAKATKKYLENLAR